MNVRRLLTSIIAACCIALFASASAYADEGSQTPQSNVLSHAVAPTGFVVPGLSSDDGQHANQASGSDVRVLEAGGQCGDRLAWQFVDGTLVISGSGSMSDFSLDDQPGWSDLRDDIESVVIKRGVNSIGAYAFAGCRNLVSVSVTSSVNELGEAAFYGCSSLRSVKLPNRVAVLPRGALAGCVSLQSFKAPGLRRIESYAFQDVEIDTLKLPKTLNEIETGAFYHSSIVSFLVENGNRTYLTKAGVLYTDDDKTLFAYPSGRSSRSFAIPPGVTRIADQAFLGSTLKSVEIPDTVKEIGSAAFQDCRDLVSVALPDSVELVGSCTFYGSGLESARFGRGLKATSYQMFRECRNLRSVSFGGLEELGAQTFANCTAFTSVTVPVNVKSIGAGAFGCTADAHPQLKGVTILGARVIPLQCFLNQTSLTMVSLSKATEEIECAAFSGCSELKVVKLPSSVQNVHPFAFPGTVRIIGKNRTSAQEANGEGEAQASLCSICQERYDTYLEKRESN